MSRAAHRLAGWLLPVLLALAAAPAPAAEEYAFDAAQFEKKTFEIGGYLQFRQEHFSLNPGGAYYKLGAYNLPQRTTLDATTATLDLTGKWRLGEGTFEFRTNSVAARDQWQHDSSNKLYEGVYSLRPDPKLTLEAGKKVMRWGKGYAWNPVGFVERPKDPNDPLLPREGYWMTDADYILNRDGPLQTIAFTPVVLPVQSHLNSDFGNTGYLNPAAKLYLLWNDTDIDFMWLGKGSRPSRFGADFSRNVTSNFEVHGEWARVQQFTKPVAAANGSVVNETGNVTSYLLGLRYLTEGDTTYILEYYRNGTGYTEQQASQFYQMVDTAFDRYQQTGNQSMLRKAATLGQGSYGRPNAGENYLYFRAQQKDAFGMLYFQPALTAMMNVQDRSYQVTPELLYTGVDNLELRMKFFMLQGGASTEFGEKLTSRRLELYARYYF